MFELSRKVQRAGVHPASDAKPATAAEGLAFEVAWNSVGADYFSTVGLPVTRGRGFTEAEATQPGPKVAIIDEVLAKKLWPDGDAVGQRIQYADQKAVGQAEAPISDRARREKRRSMEIVGIVPATRHALFETEEPVGGIYLPFARGFQSDISFFRSVSFARARKRSHHGRFASTHRARCRSFNPDHFVADVRAASRFEPGPVARSRGRGVVLHLWGTCARSRRCWSLRSQGLLRRSTHPRDWNPDGARRSDRSGVANDHARRLRHADQWSRHWPTACDRDRKTSERDSLRSSCA